MDKKYEEKFHIIVFYYVEDLAKYKNMNLNNLDEAANEDAKKQLNGNVSNNIADHIEVQNDKEDGCTNAIYCVKIDLILFIF